MKFNNKKLAFTLAEVVVVMAILGVMMAAFAPVVTKRSVTANNTFKNFSISGGHTGLFYGATNDQKNVIIGDTTTSSTFSPKLLMISNIFDTNKITPAIGFGYKKDSTTAVSYNGQLTMLKDPGDGTDYGRLVLGGKPNTNYTTSTLKKNTTIIGLNACDGITGENVICLGAYSGLLNDTTSNRIYIGRRDRAYAPSEIYFGSRNLHSLLTSTYPTSGNLSDIRLKNVGKEFTGGLDEINQLKFYNFTYKRDAEKTPRVGVMAQDLQKVFPTAVNKHDEGYLYIRKDDMFFASLNAIKELFVKMTDNSAKIKELEDRNAVLEKQVKELQDLYIDLANKVDKKSAKKKLTPTPEKPVAEEIETAPAEEN